MPHANNIATLRFLGAFFVLWGHGYSLSAGKHTEDPISLLFISLSPFHLGLSGLGVVMFFVLSGYLVTASFCKTNDIIKYAVARILRIYPALFVAVSFCVLIGLMFTTLPPIQYLEHHKTSLFFYRNITLFNDISFGLPGVFLELPWKGGVNGSLWTLPIELTMYVIVGIIGILGLFQNRQVFNLLVVILILLFINNPDNFFLLKNKHHVYLGLAFLLGSFFYINSKAIDFNIKTFILLFLLTITLNETIYYNFISLLFLSYCILWIGLSNQLHLPKLGQYGDFSYGLYLYAYPLQQISILYVGTEFPWLINLLAFIGALCMAVCSWFLVEKPVLRLKIS